jgi:signal transduction histidine kinase
MQAAPALRIGMRWWLALAFAGVAAFTAVAVVSLLSERSEDAFRRYGKEFALGNSVAAAEALKADRSSTAVARQATEIAERQHLALFVFDAKGHPLTGPSSFGLAWGQVPDGSKALGTALSGLRFIQGRADGSAYTVGLPIHRGAGAALVAYSLRPELRDQLGIVRNEYLQSALIAFGVGAALGLVIATLTARRLARIARAAREIGAGNFDVELRPGLSDEVGSLTLSIEQMRTQLQDLFRALENDRDRLERLLDRLGEGVLLVDRDLRIEYANGPAKQLLRPGDRLDAGSGWIRQLGQDLFTVGLPAHMRVKRDGRSLLISGIPPVEGGDNAILVIFDETERERSERVQREFATNAAHELRTPLASIVTAVEMLRTGAKDDPEARDEFLDVIAREADRLTRLTRALLMLARAELKDELPPPSPVDVRPLLEQVAGSLRQDDDVRVSVDCPALLVIDGDVDLLEQALSNVAANAVQHTPAGAITLSGRRDNGSVVIEVTDTGVGIPAGERERLFERFYRSNNPSELRPGGFGLGLSIAREAVTALGGKIAIESDTASGTTVRMVFPTAEEIVS